MSRIEWRPLRVIAAKELRERLRNRWILAVAAVFAVFSLVIAYLGGAQQGVVGFHGIEVTVASLVSLVIYLVPLIALILGFDAIVGERERGSLELLLSLPITRLELLLGKYLGLSAALALSTVAGFGLAGAVLASQSNSAALFHYAGFVFSAVLLGMCFLSVAVGLSVVAGDRARAGGAAVATWFIFVLVFDLVLLGALVAAADSDLGGRLLPYALLLNPADVFRVLNIFSLEDVQVFYGLATVLPDGLSSPWVLGGVILAWIVAPLLFAFWRFR